MKTTLRRLTCILCAALLLLAFTANAEAALTATVSDGTLHVAWRDCASGSCTLTAYKDGWPLSVCRVNGGTGSADIPLGAAWSQRSAYSVRLATSSGCLTAAAGKGQSAPATPAPTPIATPAPTPAATPVPTAAPTPVPTAAPTAKPTPVPTAKPTATPAAGTSQSSLAAQVVEQVNAERAKQGLGSLRVDAELSRAAQVRAKEIVQKFSHTRPDGSSWSTVSASAYGENIAMGQKTADKVMAAWMTSEGHRANILRASFGSIGVCCYVSGGVTYWVQLFGKS